MADRYIKTFKNLGIVAVPAGVLYGAMNYFTTLDFQTKIFLILVAYISTIVYVQHTAIKELEYGLKHHKHRKKGVISIQTALIILLVILTALLLRSIIGG